MFLDEVTLSNGCVELFKKTVHLKHERNHPRRFINQYEIESEFMVGSAGTICVFDARLLHQPHPNSTNSQRINLHWYVTRLDVQLP
jgi:hypothetical protein